jgi:hypothetical protein
VWAQARGGSSPLIRISRYEQGFRAETVTSDVHSEPRRFDVALEGGDGLSSVGPVAWLEAEPSEDDEIALEDGTRAVVKYMATGKQGQPVNWARRLPTGS